MLQKKISGEQVNTMVSDQYEIYHVKDVVSQNKTIYHHHDFYEIHATLKGEAKGRSDFLFERTTIYDQSRKCAAHPFQ